MDERDAEFIKALGEAWGYIKGNGEYTRKELKEWCNQLDTSLCREVLIAVIETAWTDYGGKNE